jgi:hypothetical protein
MNKLIWAALALGLAGCTGVTSTLRYSADGQAEFFIDCSGKPMTRCYDRALELCPQGYFLTKDSEVAAGHKSGTLFGGTKHVGGASQDTTIVFKNEIAVRCKGGTPIAPKSQPSNDNQ